MIDYKHTEDTENEDLPWNLKKAMWHCEAYCRVTVLNVFFYTVPVSL